MDSWDKFYQMGLPKEKSSFRLDGEFSKIDWRKPLPPEVEITPDESGELPEEFIFTDDGFFYQGHRVILYIRDQAQYFKENKITEYKFHLTNCATLKRMKTQNRYGKYVVSESTSGVFKVNYIRDNQVIAVEKSMHVCKDCLSRLNWKNYKKFYGTPKVKIYENFSLEEFFRVMNNDNKRNFDILPDYTDIIAPPNVYPPNWAIISKVLRTESGFICSDCRRKIYDIKNLHVHHVNGIKSDCSRSNLEVLCAPCHQKRHSHKILIW